MATCCRADPVSRSCSPRVWTNLTSAGVEGRGHKDHRIPALTRAVATTVATFLHVVTPPLIRFASPGFSAVMFPSAVVMSLGWLALTLWPLVEMWRGVFDEGDKAR